VTRTVIRPVRSAFSFLFGGFESDGLEQAKESNIMIQQSLRDLAVSKPLVDALASREIHVPFRI